MADWQKAHGVQWQTEEDGMVLQLLQMEPLSNVPPVVAVKGERDQDPQLVRHHFLSPNEQNKLDIDLLVRVIKPEDDFFADETQTDSENFDHLYEVVVRVLDSDTWPEALAGRTVQVRAGEWMETAVTNDDGEIMIHLPRELLQELTVTIG